jgi:small-conductance mechanosensitive channel
MKLILHAIERDPALLIQPSIAFAITLVIAYVIRTIFFAAVRKATARAQSRAGAILIESLRGPTHIWNVILALHFAIQASDLPAKATAEAPQILQALFIISLTIMFMRFAGEMIRHYGSQVTDDSSTPVTSLTQSLVELVVLLVGLIVLLNSLNVKVAPILTALGVGGLAVALALQDTLSNLFAGFYISVAGQMRLGDYIKLSTGEEGYLTDIRWRTTAIRAGTNNMIIVPNSKLAQAIVTNYSLPERRMGSSIQIMAGMEHDPERIEELLLEETRKAIPEVDGMADSEPSANLEPTGDWSLVFTVGFSVTEFGKQASVRNALRKRIIKRFHAEGIGIPYPVRTVYLHTSDPQFISDSPSSGSDGPSPSSKNPSKPA